MVCMSRSTIVGHCTQPRSSGFGYGCGTGYGYGHGSGSGSGGGRLGEKVYQDIQLTGAAEFLIGASKVDELAYGILRI